MAVVSSIRGPVWPENELLAAEKKLSQDRVLVTESADKATCPGHSSDSKEYPTGWKLFIVIVSLCLGTLLVAIDNTILAVAIPTITSTFGSLSDVGWYGSAYLLTVTALQPTFGNLYKYFHVKVTYLASIIIFEVGSVICAAAPSSAAFIIGRAIAGVGAAGLFQGALCIVGFTVPLQKRPLYLGIVVSVFGLATCFGPVLGGVFTNDLTWRWCFWINLPIGGPVLFSILLFLRLNGVDNVDRRLPLREKLEHMDIIGAATLIASVCCLLLALQWGGTSQPWNSPRIIGLFVGFGLLVVVFGILQWRLGEKATIPLRVLRQRTVLAGGLFSFLVNMSNYVDGYYIPFYFQAAQSVNATTSGIRFIALAGPETVGIVAAGAIAMKTGHYVPLMILGVIIATTGTGLLTTLSLGSSTAQWASYLVITGLGIGIGIQLPYTAMQVALSETDVAVGNAIAIFLSQLGGALAIPIAEALLVNTLNAEIPLLTATVSPQAVIRAGATNLGVFTTDPVTLRALQTAYATAVVHTLYLALASMAIALPFAIGMEWKNVQTVSVQRATEKRSADLAAQVSSPTV